MFSTDDTIVAIASPPGRASIGVIRLSGRDAADISHKLLTRHGALEPRRATLARIRDLAANNGAAGDDAGTGAGGRDEGRVIDEVIVTLFPGPHSYTGEDVVEISAHGSPVLLRRIVSSALRAGARLAAPGEFTLRAFLNGRMDLVQAEAVADLVDAVTPAQARQAFDQLEGTVTREMRRIGEALFDLIVKLEASLDFPDEGYHFIVPEEVSAGLDRVLADVDALLEGAQRGRVIREGRQVAIIGGTNVGKSSLFNALVGTDRAIVTEIAGTTRDLLTERCDIDGVPVTLIDTAGVRDTEEIVEREGVHRARGAAQVADLALVVLDRSQPLRDEDRSFIAARAVEPAATVPGTTRLVVLNKIDLPAAWRREDLSHANGSIVELSVRTGEGLDQLRQTIGAALIGEERLRDTAGLSNVRHIDLLVHVREAVERARTRASEGAPEELALADLHEAMDALDEITGKRSSEDVLQAIFARFCIGK